MRLNPAGHRPAPRNQTPRHEGGSPKAPAVESLIREAHELLTVAGMSLSPTKVTRVCRQYARQPHGTLADRLAEALQVKDDALARLMAEHYKHRGAKSWGSLGSQPGAWPVVSC